MKDSRLNVPAGEDTRLRKFLMCSSLSNKAHKQKLCLQNSYKKKCTALKRCITLSIAFYKQNSEP